ncbi:MAG: xanthine dehydrogenase family protein subunit M [Oligoflexia bacterium]|nr:xanthine dehydrogenase family protein subunit M [Oligoflexia bacterium]
MAIQEAFEYAKPKTLREATKLLRKNKGAMVLAGGTDLVGYLKEGFVSPSLVIDIKSLAELKKIEFKGNALHIGALVTFTDILESKVVAKKLPVLREIAEKVASVGIRNRATLVGNICSAVPCLDSGPVLVAMDGVVHVKSTLGARKIPAEKWFLGARKTARKPGELVTGVSIPLPKGKAAGCYLKLGRYQGEDLAQASVFVLMVGGKKPEFRVAFGSVGPVPSRGRRIEKSLNAGESETAARALVGSEIKPITDIRATREYRLHMCEVMLERAVQAARARLTGDGPAYGAAII